MKKLLFALLLTWVTAGFISCDFINPPEQIPAYIHIDSFTLKGNYDSTGSVLHTITDAWVIVDGKLIGAFELPATIPVLAEGSKEMIIRAGIKENGIENTRTAYPFYQMFKIQHNFVPAKVDTFNPIIYYISSGFKANILEDFEGANMLFEENQKNNAIVGRTSLASEVYEGEHSYRAILAKKDDILEIQTEDLYDLPRGKAVFIELNFKTDEVLALGYYSINSSGSVQHSIINLNETKTWKKIYINLGSELSFEATNNVFRFFIGTINTKSDTSRVFIDNFKVLSVE